VSIVFLGLTVFFFALSLRFLTKSARVLPSILGSLFFSIFFACLAYALSWIFEDGLEFVIGVATLLAITALLIIEFLLRVLEKLDKSQSVSSEGNRLESDGTQLKAAALYNSFDYISQLDAAKVDKNLSREFWEELTNYRNRGMFARDQRRTILGNADVEGKFINVHSGLRVTPDQPTDSVGKVHLFGGSTIFAYEVTDEHTPSAFLQRQFNKLDIRYSVLNHGVGGSTIGDCLRRIKLLNLSKSDVVLVLFGDNDIGINSPRKIVGRGIFRVIPFWGKLLLVLKSHSRILNWIFLETVEYKYTDLETNASLLGNTISNYLQIGEYLKSLNIPVCFVLQPNLYTKVPTSEDEIRLKSTYPKYWEQIVVSGYRTLRDSLESDSCFLDISDLFNDKSGSYFLDWAHVNSIGNEVISSVMFNVLRGRELI
jgi:lysophospholipase L1-like esterase